jgi:hypothetical protein
VKSTGTLSGNAGWLGSHETTGKWGFPYMYFVLQSPHDVLCEHEVSGAPLYL